MGKAGSGTRGVFISRVVSIMLALPVVTAEFLVALAGVRLLGWGATWPLQVVGALLLVPAAVVTFKRRRLPARAAVVPRNQSPRLHSLISEVAACVGAAEPATVLLVPEFNAFVTTVRWRPVLAIGAPLWLALTPQGRIALLAHELGHNAHGDLGFGRITRRALRTMVFWAHAVDPGDLLAMLLTLPIRLLLSGYSWVLLHAMAAAQRRQEYRADLAAHRAAGRSGALDLLSILTAAVAFEVVINHAALQPDRPEIEEAIRRRARELTPRQLAGYRAEAAQALARVDDSHPATELRIRLLESLPDLPPAVLDGGRFDQIDLELQPAVRATLKAIGDDIRFQW